MSTKGITADHENWIEQHNKQDSYSRKVETFLNDAIIVNKYSSVDIWVCPFIVHMKEGGLISPLETVIYSKLKSWEKKINKWHIHRMNVIGNVLRKMLRIQNPESKLSQQNNKQQILLKIGK